jgi:GNAT superfamily N-acetyltransferase
MPMLEKLAHKARTVGRLLHEDRGRLFRIVRGNFSIFIVHAAELLAVAPPSERPDLEVRPISGEALNQIAAIHPELNYQLEVLTISKESSAYAVYESGKFAGLCWLITPDLDRRFDVRLVRLGPGEVEIGKAFTLPEYRGRGLYPFAIRSVCRVARAQGAGRVFMVTNWDNATSRRGIEKAGLKRLGWIVVIEPPLMGTMFRPIMRLFRMRLPAGPKSMTA